MRICIFLIVILCSFGIAYGEQACNPAMTSSTPDSQFTVYTNGTVTDNKTGLMWKQCVEGKTYATGACSPDTTELFSWSGALLQPASNNASNAGFAGYENWRLPNIKELTSIVEEKCYNPAINLTSFPDTPSSDVVSSTEGYVWSGSPYYDAVTITKALIIDFTEGYVLPVVLTETYHVRLVRDIE